MIYNAHGHKLYFSLSKKAQFETVLGIIFSFSINPMTYYSFYLPFTFLPIFLAGLYFLFEEKLSSPRLRWAWWVGSLILIAFVGFYVIQDHALYDYFKGYYHGGRKIIRNIDVLYDEACYGFTNFPLFAYLFIPLANLPKELSGRIFYLIGYIFLLPLAYWLITASNVKGWKRFLVLGLLALNGPLDYSIWLGNTTQIVMLFVLLAFFSLNLGWEWLSGILLGVGGLIKLPLVLPSGYFFLRGKWKVVGGGLLVAGMVLFLSLIFIPFEINSIWLERCVLMMAGNPTAAYNNQSISGFLARIYMPGNYGWDPLTPTVAYITASNIGRLLLAIPAVYVLIAGGKTEKTALQQAIEFFIILVFSLLTSPIAWTHYFVLLLIPAAMLLGNLEELTSKTWIYILLGLSLIPLSVPKDLSLALFEWTGATLMLSPQFIGSLVFYGLLLSLWWALRKRHSPLHD